MLLKDGAIEMFGPRAEVLKRLMAPRQAEVAAPPPAAARIEGSAA
jgi:ABC-type protease/lipase transport system fused ATPase/permease subunit